MTNKNITSADQLMIDYALYVGQLAIEALEPEVTSDDFVSYIVDPEEYIDLTVELAELPPREVAKEFLSRFYKSEQIEEFLSRYNWE
ncbi:hypothetical protein MHB54_27840 [Paenibacillus sp. FSL M7-0802]|uniref:hypothetical protein n=1 Tax=Paenibacillus sp. FSL M7-0802 TaxID=2921536 RepID=UPI0030FCD85C